MTNKPTKFDSLINVTQPKLPDFNEFTKHLKDIWDRKWLTNDGPKHNQFKDELKNYLSANNVELFTNGHLALEIAIKALELKGEIITTPFTFASTTHAIVNCGLTPIFCDVDSTTYNIDVNQIEKHITDQTSAILAVHVFGTPCDVEGIQEIADKYNLKVIYDAAHAFGVEIDGKPIGNFGDISMFSLHATKVFNSIEGGLLTFNDETLTSKLKALKNFGLTTPDSVDYVGTNAKMNEFQASMGLCNLSNIEEDIGYRKYVSKLYTEGLKNLSNITLLFRQENIRHNYSYYPVLLKDVKMRDELHENLKKYNIITRKYFYPLVNDFNCYNFDSSLTPVAKNISERVLCLPIYSDLDPEVVKAICNTIRYELGEMSND
ncbi:DegT/DnrJ/EryC1/StrS family aminotransferase [Bacillus suaedaesalsae]|uniref:DegT/DnrJ/EryC1/StrS family aminotransferase n=1 Tax=Bacillus suaedaesalsae TaxID=2810349 RepID=A0ABS2DNI8_9BACI|nr:DegT/DnrJ/EryC1/StrS family aminotransferase [Bacillus suaedaesalsae]MBM6619091.1 DegT/DnrJ/EryC1/StrS family aminotransferase [Bacillus suaedaesalsae]